jgi:hypothetical protein
MNCKEFEKMIPAFLNRELDFITLKQFQEHREKCRACREELEIQFLVAEGIQHLEEGDSFDMQKELNHQLLEADRKVRFHTRFLRGGEQLELLVCVLLAALIIWILV